MFLKKVKSGTSQVGARITLWYLGLLVFTLTALFILFYFLYLQSLIQNDHNIIEEKVRVYEKIIKDENVAGLKKYMANINNSPEGRNDFFIRIESFDHKEIYFYPEKETNKFNRSEIEYSLAKFKSKKLSEWIYVKTKMKEDDVELHNKLLDNGMFLQVGLKVDDRDDLLETFLGLYLIVLIGSLILGWFGGVFLSNKTLRPVRDLIDSLKRINHGDDKVRLTESSNQDELSDLIIQFNLMLDRVEKTNDSMRSTIDIVAHELRTPLTSFRAMAEMAILKEENVDNLKETLHELIEGIDEVLNEFKMMTEITEMESGVKNLNLELIDIKVILDEVIDLYEMVAEQKEIVIKLSYERSLDLLIDRRKIRQALANLIDNAIKYSPENTVIEIIAKPAGHATLIQIKDHGIGITPEDIPLVFKRLYRGENSRKEKGIGLGLSLVQSIFIAHNSTIQVTSEIGAGTTFTIMLKGL